MPDFSLEFSKGQDQYKVEFFVRDINFVKQIAVAEDFASKSAEEALAVVLEKASPALELVIFYKNGLKNDGPNGEPATQGFHPNGQIKFKLYFKDGKDNDPSSGEAAHVEFDEQGEPIHALRYRDGIQTSVATVFDSTPEEIKDFCDPKKYQEHLNKTKQAFGKNFRF